MASYGAEFLNQNHNHQATFQQMKQQHQSVEVPSSLGTKVVNSLAVISLIATTVLAGMAIAGSVSGVALGGAMFAGIGLGLASLALRISDINRKLEDRSLSKPQREGLEDQKIMHTSLMCCTLAIGIILASLTVSGHIPAKSMGWAHIGALLVALPSAGCGYMSHRLAENSGMGE